MPYRKRANNPINAAAAAEAAERVGDAQQNNTPSPKRERETDRGNGSSCSFLVVAWVYFGVARAHNRDHHNNHNCRIIIRGPFFPVVTFVIGTTSDTQTTTLTLTPPTFYASFARRRWIRK